MSSRNRAARALGVLLVIGGVALTASPAWAHVEIDPGSLPKGSTTTFAFRVPTEEQNANTVKLDVQFPTNHPLPNVLVQVKPGWTFTTRTEPLRKPITTDDGTFTSAVSEVTWTATPGGGIPPGAFDLFSVFTTLPTNANALTFKAIQTYSDGNVVKWLQIPTKGAPPPDFPAPTLTLTKAQPASG
jgi:uncharacterized protein YcnI